MSRPPRIEVADGVFHVVSRGNERQFVFRDDADRLRFLEILAHVVERYCWRVLCYCLMGNHYHLLVQTPSANLARGMRQLNGVYAQSFNRRHDRVGHLFQGRYTSLLVQTDAHLLTAVRYIVRNPLRARLVARVGDWPWTSHGATIGVAEAGVVAVTDLHRYIGGDVDGARRRYLRLVTDDGDSPSPDHPLIDGDDLFIEHNLAAIEPCPEYPRAYVVPRRIALTALVSSLDESAALYRAHTEHGYSLRQLACHLGCGVTTVHRRIRRYERVARSGDGRPEWPSLTAERGRPDP